MQFEEFVKKVDALGDVLDNAKAPELDITMLSPGDRVFRARVVLDPSKTSIEVLHCIVDTVTKKQFIIRAQGSYANRYLRVSDNFGGWKQSCEDAILALGLSELRRLSHEVTRIHRKVLHGRLSAEALLETLKEQATATEKSSIA